jgi:hypothetical protein
MAAFVRLYQPEEPNAALTQSSYLRLGAYSSDEESLVTNLTTTTSTNATIAPPFGGGGDNIPIPVDTVTNTYNSDNKGVLAYTDKDFQANVQGAALMKFGNGHTTEVTNGDAKYTVDQGNYTISADLNVSITAGANGKPANIELTASDYIKQNAGGPTSILTTGNFDSQTVGNTSDFYFGTKFSCMIGSEMALNFALSLTVTFAYEVSVTLGGSLGVNIGFDNSLIIGNQIAIQVGVYFKQVTGQYVNLVIGDDVKGATASMKVVQTYDFKAAVAGDIKNVGLNFTQCLVDAKIAETELKGAQLEAAKKQLVAKLAQLETKALGFQTKTAEAVLYM